MTKSLRVLTWNIHGAYVPSRSKPEKQKLAWLYIKEIDADISLIQEASEAGFADWMGSVWTVLKGEKGIFKKRIGWGSVITARPGLNLRARLDLFSDPWLEALYDYVLIGEVDLPDEKSAIISSVHCPPQALTNFLKNKPELLKSINLDTLTRPGCEGIEPWGNDFTFFALNRYVEGNRFIVGGDWNTSRGYDDRRAPRGTAFFRRAAERGWIECFKGPEEQSYFKDGSGPYQVDHIFSDSLTASYTVKSSVLANDTTKQLSDHAPVVVDFEFIV